MNFSNGFENQVSPTAQIGTGSNTLTLAANNTEYNIPWNASGGVNLNNSSGLFDRTTGAMVFNRLGTYRLQYSFTVTFLENLAMERALQVRWWPLAGGILNTDYHYWSDQGTGNSARITVTGEFWQVVRLQSQLNTGVFLRLFIPIGYPNNLVVGINTGPAFNCAFRCHMISAL